MLNSKFYQIGDREEGIENDYTIEVIDHHKHTELIMRRGTGSNWSKEAQGEEVFRMEDDGNGLKFKNKIGKTLDYSEFAELYILMRFINVMGHKHIYLGTIRELSTKIEF